MGAQYGACHVRLKNNRINRNTSIRLAKKRHSHWTPLHIKLRQTAFTRCSISYKVGNTAHTPHTNRINHTLGLGSIRMALSLRGRRHGTGCGGAQTPPLHPCDSPLTATYTNAQRSAFTPLSSPRCIISSPPIPPAPSLHPHHPTQPFRIRRYNVVRRWCADRESLLLAQRTAACNPLSPPPFFSLALPFTWRTSPARESRC